MVRRVLCVDAHHHAEPFGILPAFKPIEGLQRSYEAMKVKGCHLIWAAILITNYISCGAHNLRPLHKSLDVSFRRLDGYIVVLDALYKQGVDYLKQTSTLH